MGRSCGGRCARLLTGSRTLCPRRLTIRLSCKRLKRRSGRDLNKNSLCVCTGNQFPHILCIFWTDFCLHQSLCNGIRNRETCELFDPEPLPVWVNFKRLCRIPCGRRIGSTVSAGASVLKHAPQARFSGLPPAELDTSASSSQGFLQIHFFLKKDKGPPVDKKTPLTC